MAPMTPMYKHCLMIRLCPKENCQSNLESILSSLYLPYLQSHQETFAFNIRKAKIDAARVTVDIPIPDNVLHLRVDATNETIR
jgi:hypothetical protein